MAIAISLDTHFLTFKLFAMKNVFTLFLLWAFATCSWSQSYWINEVDYLGDTQGLEVMGPAGAALSDLSLIFYKVDGTIDRIENLDGTIPGNGMQMNAVWYDVAMSQPAPGTGGSVALVDQAGSVLHFISYGLTSAVTAVEGAAVGLSSELIGVQLMSGVTLQLIGQGLEYADFIWSLPGLATPGSLNLTQFVGNVLGGILGLFEAQPSPIVQKVSVWPNPAMDVVRIQWKPGTVKSTTEMQLIDLNGRILRRAVSDDQGITEWTVSELPEGLYLVQFLREGQVIDQQKLIKR